MIRNNEHALAVADLFATAALEGDWSTALNAFGEACGADGAKLVGVGPDATVPFAYTPRVDPAALAEFVALGGGHPSRNPRAQLAMRACVLESCHDIDIEGGAEISRHDLYADFCRRWDFLYGSQATMIRNDQMTVALLTHRKGTRGPPEAEDRRAFDALAPHAYAALKLQKTLEGRGADLLAGMLDAVEVAAFVCDGFGLVQSLTPAAEAVLRRGPLRLKLGKLSASRASDRCALESAIKAAVGDGVNLHAPARSTLIVRDADASGRFEVVEVSPLPRKTLRLGFEPRAVVTVRARPRDDAELSRLLQTAFSLTSSEAAVLARLASGESRESIAAERQVRLDTVQMQIKRAFAKMNVHREAELIALIGRFR
jgi:DNA-binding CsgD family transcriptional regulator